MTKRTTVSKKILGHVKTWGIAEQVDDKYQLIGIYENRNVARDVKRRLGTHYKLVRISGTFSTYNK